MGTLTAHAVDYPYLTFVLTDGSKASVSVASDVALTFSGQTLTIGTEKEFALTNLSQMYFSTTDETQGVTGISETLATGLDDAAEIYDLRGNRVSRDSDRLGWQVYYGNGYHVLVTNNADTPSLHDITVIMGDYTSGSEQNIRFLRALIQQYNNRLINNKLTLQ